MRIEFFLLSIFTDPIYRHDVYCVELFKLFKLKNLYAIVFLILSGVRNPRPQLYRHLNGTLKYFPRVKIQAHKTPSFKHYVLAMKKNHLEVLLATYK